MRIDFFEEYPTPENLAKAKLITFPSTVYLAAHSLAEFNQYKVKLHAVNPALETAYWPLLPKSYWTSAFSYPNEIKKLHAELTSYNEPLTVLLDLELPLLRPSLFVRNVLSFFYTKRLIRSLFKLCERGITFHTAEYGWTTGRMNWFARFLSITFSEDYPFRRILMWYSSMLPRIARTWRNSLVLDTHTIVGLGTIAIGVLGNEPILSPVDLEDDLKFFNGAGISRAVIFRLGGLTGEYLSIINKYV